VHQHSGLHMMDNDLPLHPSTMMLVVPTVCPMPPHSSDSSGSHCHSGWACRAALSPGALLDRAAPPSAGSYLPRRLQVSPHRPSASPLPICSLCVCACTGEAKIGEQKLGFIAWYTCNPLLLYLFVFPDYWSGLSRPSPVDLTCYSKYVHLLWQ
jgi:hypothetical protein